jgi:FtsP/CotA-like multicopper oxidase with cupredoxin domain
MRMNPRDILDVASSTIGTGLCKPKECVRLCLIDGSAMTHFDFRIPMFEIIVAAAYGEPIRPITVDEIRIAVAQPYGVIVKPKGDGRSSQRSVALRLLGQHVQPSFFAEISMRCVGKRLCVSWPIVLAV